MVSHARRWAVWAFAKPFAKPFTKVFVNGWACAALVFVAAAWADDDLSFLPDGGDANLTFYLDNDLFASEDENPRTAASGCTRSRRSDGRVSP